MNLKKIVRKGIATVGLIAAIGAGAEGLPKIKPDQMGWIMYGQHENGVTYINIGYDTDGDKLEDTRFHYQVVPTPGGLMYSRLMSYGVDADRDGIFREDEWFTYVQKEKNEGLYLKEPENKREV